MDPTTLTATQQLHLLRTRSISAVELLRAHLANVAEHNPRLNAVVTLDEQRAFDRAGEADAAASRGEWWGPLHGLPMTLKDGFSTAGMRTTSGYEPLKDYVPEQDSTVAARLKAAGAIIFGKTNVSPLLGDIQSDNPIFGRTNNPYDLGRTSGGSSGGAAAALATHMTPLEVGSDYAGSIRIPSAFCGVYGLKTTEHRVSMYGHIPDLPGRPRRHRSLWSIGPMSRSIEDLALLYSVIAGPDAHEPDVPPVGIPASDEQKSSTSLSIAFATSFPGVPIESAIEAAILDAAAKLDAAGCDVSEQLPGIDFHELAQNRMIISRSIMDETDLPSLPEYLDALDARDRIIREWEAFFTTYDALICPVSMTTAFPHTPTGDPIYVDGTPVNYWRAIGHCAPFNFTGHPAITIPIAVARNNLPIGIQLVGKRWGESRLLQIAQQLSKIVGITPGPNV